MFRWVFALALGQREASQLCARELRKRRSDICASFSIRIAMTMVAVVGVLRDYLVARRVQEEALLQLRDESQEEPKGGTCGAYRR